MAKLPIEELVQQCPSLYKLTVLAAKRAKALSEGAPPLVRADVKKATSLALEELRRGKVVYVPPEEEAGSATGGRTKSKKGASGESKRKKPTS